MGERLRAIVLGASSGIGKEIAIQLAGKNWQVAVTGRRKAMLDEMAASLFPGDLLVSVFDMNELDELPARLDELVSRLGGLDLLVISAGCGFLNPELSFELELRTVKTNVAAFTVAVDWAFNFFKKQGKGHIAAITSVGGLTGEGAAPSYPASKAYQILYLDSLRKRASLEKFDCHITELRPGSVDTDMMKGEGHFWISTPQQAAKLACRAIIDRRRLQYISRRWSLIGFILRGLALFK